MDAACPLAGCGEMGSSDRVLQRTGAGHIPSGAKGLMTFLVTYERTLLDLVLGIRDFLPTSRSWRF